MILIPANTKPQDLIETINDRLRRIPGAAAGAGAAGTMDWGTHATRKGAATAAEASLFYESDRGVVYQVRQKRWTYAGGTGAAAVAARPADLGPMDAGYLFLATDTFQQYRWSGSAWVEVTQGELAQLAYASGGLVLTNAFADVVGATITLTRAGRHLVTGTFDLSLAAAGDAGQTLFGQLVADSAAQAQLVTLAGAVGTRWMASQQWLYTAGAAGKVVKLQAKKSGGTGASSAATPGTSISALWIGP